ncbi:ATP-dependent helicase [Homoserinibacter sp. YIM 151385]|uniref:ATP-dependent helicase n=1 Tax=Homoserinibacter sp. YIM 151385 TaxID=2985506 RepID=UPI0022F0CDF5|nr:ATP-dependent helicase [Homoserinibacter sp. YIM 151385]WBU38155.1 ATP-dependent helicase [Homoserinibacter sp. YIM 151385]
MSGGSGSILDGLDAEQRVAAETLLGPVCVLAGAGSGKTRTITHRIAHGVTSGVYTAERVMALTFTTRAAGELRSRLRELGAGGVSARTFHSAALAQLSYFWPQLVGGPLPRVLPGKAATLAQAAEGLRLRLDTAALRDVAGEIEWRKVTALGMDAYERTARTRTLPGGLGVEAMVELHRAYESLKDERRQLDFEDVLLVTAGMIEAEPRVAEQVHESYRFFVVDEYQDVSPLQQRLLDLWLGSRSELCVVGDASQTIYSFTGATSEYLLGFGSRYEDATVVRLERNHRSTQPVLDLANRLMRGRPGALELRPAAPAPGPQPTSAGHPDDAGEADAVADAVAAQLREGTAPEQIAVLCRVNAQLALVEQAFARKGISTRVLGSARFFEHPAVQRAMLELHSLAGAPQRGPLFQVVSDVLRQAGWTLEPPAGAGAERERWEVLTALVELADRAPEGATLRAFADELFARKSSQHEPSVSAVVLSTLHSSKGLEWDSVHILGLNEGLLPISHARGLEAIDEERRLLYVGITRARRSLSLTWSGEGLRGQRRQPSRFLDELRSGTRDARRGDAG